MRAARDLHHAQQSAGQHDAPEPAARQHRIRPAQHEPAAQQREGGAGVAGGEAVPAAAVGDAEAPMRDVQRPAAELGQVPGAAGQAGLLEERHDRRAGDGDPQPPDPFTRRQRAQQRPAQVDHQQGNDQPAQRTRAVVQSAAQQPVVAPGEAAGVAEQARRRQIQSRGVPGQKQRQAERGPGEVDPQAPPPVGHRSRERERLWHVGRAARRQCGCTHACARSSAGSRTPVCTSSRSSRVWNRWSWLTGCAARRSRHAMSRPRAAR